MPIGLGAGAASLLGNYKKPVVPVVPVGTPMPIPPKPPTVAIEGPGMMPPAPAPAPAPAAAPAPAPIPGDLRQTAINIGVSPLQNQASSQLADALKSFQSSANIPAWKPTAGPNYGAATGTLDQAKALTTGASLKDFASIGATDPSQTQGMLQTALGQASSPEAAALRAKGMASLDTLSTGPNRAELAAQALQLQRERTQPAWQNDLRQAGQSAAALGRLGSGMTTTELGDLTLQREKALGQYGEDAALHAADAEMSDRLARFNATAGYGGQLSAEDLAKAGFTTGNALNRFNVANTVRGQNVDERGYQTDQNRAQADLAMRKAGGLSAISGQQSGMAENTATFAAQQQQAARAAAMQRAALQEALVSGLSGVQNTQFNQGLAGANLATQQQGRQDSQAQQAIENERQRLALEEALTQGQWGRDFSVTQAQANTGNANEPWGTALDGSAQTQGQASNQAAALAEQQRQAAYARMLAEYQQGRAA